MLFDSKPVIMKPWSPGLDVMKEKVTDVPIWIRLPGLDLKYWGRSALMKIAGILGKPIKTDRATAQKDILDYARVMVEVAVEGSFLMKLNL